VPTRASGTFEVKLSPLETEHKGDANLGRMSIDKQFQGDLVGASYGEMLTAGTAVKGSASYVAIERVDGTLQSRKGRQRSPCFIVRFRKRRRGASGWVHFRGPRV